MQNNRSYEFNRPDLCVGFVEILVHSTENRPTVCWVMATSCEFNKLLYFRNVCVRTHTYIHSYTHTQKIKTLMTGFLMSVFSLLRLCKEKAAVFQFRSIYTKSFQYAYRNCFFFLFFFNKISQEFMARYHPIADYSRICKNPFVKTSFWHHSSGAAFET